MKRFNSSLTSPLIEEYILDKTRIEDPMLDEMHEFAKKSEVPIVGPLVGKFLYLVALIKDARSVFEMGSGFGYSAYWFSKAFGGDGRIVCTDYSTEHKESAEGFFKKANIEECLEFIAGNSLEILMDSDGLFDIIFIDVDKEHYPGVIDIAYEKLEANGLLIVDNTLWYGRVVEDDDDLPSTKGVKEFNDRISNDQRFITSMIPLRDGITICYKKG